MVQVEEPTMPVFAARSPSPQADARAEGYAHRMAIAKRFLQRAEAGDAVFMSGRTAAMDLPHTVSAGERRPIAGLNRWMLLQVMQDQGWGDARFFTQQQIDASGWALRESAQPVVLQYLKTTDRTGTALAVPEVQKFAVFNAVHVDGVPAPTQHKKPTVKALANAMMAADFEPGARLLSSLSDWVSTQYSELADQGDKAREDLVQALAISSIATQIDWRSEHALQEHAAQWEHPAWRRQIAELISADPAAFFDAIRVSEIVVAQVITQTRIAQQQLDTSQEIDAARRATGADAQEHFGMRHQPEKQGQGREMKNNQPDQAPADSGRSTSQAAYDARVEEMFAERQAVLAVPFADKDRAKFLGAVWYRQQMVWFVPKDLAMHRFKEWDPREHCLGRTAAESEVIDNFRKEMESMGLDTSKDIKADGQWHNVRVVSNKGKNLSGAYVLDLAGRDGTPTGSINNKYTGESHFWTFDGPLMTPEQKARMRADAQRRAEEADRAQQRAQATAAEHAAEIVARGEPAGDHGYVRKKGIPADGCVQVSGRVLLGYEEFFGESGRTAIREDQNYLIVPMRNASGQIRAAQAINEDGSVKSFMRGAQKKGTMAVLGAPSLDALCAQAVASSQQMFVANFVEGFATGASLRSATGLPVVVCFDAGNLEAVASDAAEKVPANLLPVLAVDNDQFYVERALGYLCQNLGINPNSQRGSVVEVLSGKDSTRMISLGDAVADGEWHQAPQGRYRMTLEREPESTEVRSISMEVTRQEAQRTERLVFSNRGLEAGRTAQEAFAGRAEIVVPEFKQLGGRPTDWNDMAAIAGGAEIAKQIRGALEYSPHLAVQHRAQQPNQAPQRQLSSGGVQR